MYIWGFAHLSNLLVYLDISIITPYVIMGLSITIYLSPTSQPHLSAKKYFSTPSTSYLGLRLSSLSKSLWYQDWDIDIRKEPTWLNWSDLKLQWPFVSGHSAHTWEKKKKNRDQERSWGPEEQSSDENFKPLSQFINEMKQKETITTTAKNR